jgi:hypothetical protein
LLTSSSHQHRARRTVRIVSGVIAAGALVIGFSLIAGSAAAVPGDPTNVTAPVVSGLAIVGSTVSVSDGAWVTDDGTLTFSYRWSDGNNFELSTQPDYQVDSADIGQTLTATVTATDSGNNSEDASTTMSSVVVASDVVNTIAPVISGSVTPGSTLTVNTGTWTAPSGQTITYTYSWGYSTGQSGGPLDPADVTSTHVVDSSDFGHYLVALVTASAGGQQVTARATTDTVVTPAPPVASDAGLTAANQGTVTGSQSTTTATVTVASGTSGDTVFVYGYSSPTKLGFFTLNASRKITVPLASLSSGLHKLAVVNSSGVLVGWLSVTAGGGLASTGVNVDVPLVVGGAGVLLLLGVLSFLYAGRARRNGLTL